MLCYSNGLDKFRRDNARNLREFVETSNFDFIIASCEREALPPWFTALLAEARSDNTCWWHIYLDNFVRVSDWGPPQPQIGEDSAMRQQNDAGVRPGVISSEKKPSSWRNYGARIGSRDKW